MPVTISYCLVFGYALVSGFTKRQFYSELFRETTVAEQFAAPSEKSPFLMEHGANRDIDVDVVTAVPDSMGTAEAMILADIRADELEDFTSEASTDDGDSILEVKTWESGKPQGQSCIFYSSTVVRRFHFQLQHFAVELIRSPRFPRLMVYPNQSWKVRLTDDSNDPLDWTLTPMDGKKLVPPIEIDFVYDTQYIEQIVTDGEPNGLRIVYKNGTAFEFAGGIHYVDSVLARTVRSVENGQVSKILSNNTPPTTLSSTMDALRTGAQKVPQQVANTALNSAATNAVIVGGVGLFLGSGYAYAAGEHLVADYVAQQGWQSTVDVVNWALGLFGVNLASIAEEAARETSIGPLLPLLGNSPAEVLAQTAKGSVVGAAGGLAAGLVTGLAVGVAQGVSHTILTWIRNNRNLKLTASEKIFEKLHCHSAFLRCHNGRVLVPKLDRFQKGVNRTGCPDLGLRRRKTTAVLSQSDFLWNIHTVLEHSPDGLPVQHLKDTYFDLIGHPCKIEHFLVVGQGGIPAAMKRIPHIVKVVTTNNGNIILKPKLPAGISKEQLMAVDLAYKRQLKAKRTAQTRLREHSTK